MRLLRSVLLAGLLGCTTEVIDPDTPGRDTDVGESDPSDPGTDSDAGPIARCGDGVTQGQELCDDGNDDNTDACLDTCIPAWCGDGYVQQDVEACDPASAGAGSGPCSRTCQRPRATILIRAGGNSTSTGLVRGTCVRTADTCEVTGDWSLMSAGCTVACEADERVRVDCTTNGQNNRELEDIDVLGSSQGQDCTNQTSCTASFAVEAASMTIRCAFTD